MARKTDSNNPADWLLYAESDLQGVRLLSQREVSYQMCRSKLTEVVEKVIKAELIHAGWFLERTHDLERLLQHLEDRGSPAAPLAVPLCDALADAYFIDRYPGFDLEDPEWEKLRLAISQCDALLVFVKTRIALPIP